jgi:hypothetical protein
MSRTIQHIQLISLFLISLFLIGCGGGGSSEESKVQPNPAVISSLDLSSNTVGLDTEATISFSSFAGGESIKTQIVVAPEDSLMLNQEFVGSSFEVSFDAVGLFKVQVTIKDNAGTVNREFDVNTINSDPLAHVTGMNKSNIFTAYMLSGVESVDSDGHVLIYNWSLLSKPEGSQLNEDLGETSDIIFYPDVKGSYSVKLKVNDGFKGESEQIFDFTIGAFKFQRLVFNIVDAVYSSALDKLIIAGDDRKLYVYSPETHDTQVISLAHQGTSVSVLADGSKAAVGHNGKISLIDLNTFQVEEVYSISTDVFDLEISSNGYVYAMPRTDQWETLRAINLNSGEEIQQAGNSVRAGTVIKMHPSQKYIYGANRGLSPSDIEKYDIRTGSPKYLYDSPYHGDYGMCGDLWMSQDGLRIFTKCGNVFRSSEVRDQDMKYNGKIELAGRISSLSHYQDSVVYIDDSAKNFVNFYSYGILESQSNEELPLAIVNDKYYQTEAKFVFHRIDGSVITLVEVDEASGFLFNYGIAYTPSGIEDYNLKPLAIVDENKYVNINELSEISAASSFDPENADITYSWELVSKPESSVVSLNSLNEVITGFVPDQKGMYQIRLKVNDGEQDSSYATITITAEDPSDKKLIELGFEVTVSSYSEQLNKVVLIASNPNQLILFDISDNSMETMDLTGSSSVLTLSLSGTTAAVGFENSVAIIDLNNKKVIKTLPVSSNIIDLVLPDNDFLYVFPKSDQWERIRTINLSTGEEQSHIGSSIYAGTMADLHPSGNYIYGADNGLSPSDIELYDITNGNATYVKDSPYHGDYSMCGNIWIAEDGLNSFTPCGNVFKANPGQDDDMTYVGKLNVSGSIKGLSQKGTEIAIINTDAWWYNGGSVIGHVINFYGYPDLSFVRSVDIPTTIINSVEYKNYGVNIFHSLDGNKIIALVKIESEAGKLYEYSLFIYSK